MSEHFITSIPLYVNEYAYSVLTKRFNVAHHIYNCFLGECKKRRDKYLKSDLYKEAGTKYKEFAAKKVGDKKEINELFKSAITESGFYLRSNSHGRDNSLEQFAASTIQRTWLGDHIDSHCRNKLMERAFKAAQRSLKKELNKRTGGYERPKLRFKRFGRDYICSLEGKNSISPLKFEFKNEIYQVVWRGLSLPVYFDENDDTIKHAINNIENISYIRLKRKPVRGKWQYYADLIIDGKRLLKEKNKLGEGVVGGDLGPGTLACVSNEFVILRSTASNVLESNAYLKLEKQRRIIQRQIDRQRREANPDNFNENGTIKKGSKWIVSKRQKHNENQLADLQRRIKEMRRDNHGAIANELRSHGDEFRLDKDSYKGWQRSRYGSSLLKHAPGMLVELIRDKFENTGGKIDEINTYDSKSSQTCPNCGDISKKQLDERIHDCKCGFIMQRDIVSAIVNKFWNTEKKTLDVDKSKRFIKDKRSVLQAGIEKILQSVREGHLLPSTFGTIPELERIACQFDDQISSDACCLQKTT